MVAGRARACVEHHARRKLACEVTCPRTRRRRPRRRRRCAIPSSGRLPPAARNLPLAVEGVTLGTDRSIAHFCSCCGHIESFGFQSFPGVCRRRACLWLHPCCARDRQNAHHVRHSPDLSPVGFALGDEQRGYGWARAYPVPKKQKGRMLPEPRDVAMVQETSFTRLFTLLDKII